VHGVSNVRQWVRRTSITVAGAVHTGWQPVCTATATHHAHWLRLQLHDGLAERPRNDAVHAAIARSRCHPIAGVRTPRHREEGRRGGQRYAAGHSGTARAQHQRALVLGADH
jgi:hypothetical protein